MSAIAVAFWRFVCACVVLLPLIGRSRLRALADDARHSGRVGAVALGSAAFQLLYFLAVRDVGVAVGTLIALGLAPIATTAAESLAARTRPAARTSLVLGLAVTGLVLVTAVGSSTLQVAPRPALGCGRGGAVRAHVCREHHVERATIDPARADVDHLRHQPRRHAGPAAGGRHRGVACSRYGASDRRDGLARAGHVGGRVRVVLLGPAFDPWQHRHDRHAARTGGRRLPGRPAAARTADRRERPWRRAYCLRPWQRFI